MQSQNPESTTSDSVTIYYSEVASATFTAEYVVTWQPHTETTKYDFGFDRIISEIGGEEPPFHVNIDADVNIEPETLNLASKGAFTAFIKLPKGYDVNDIDLSTVYCQGTPATMGVVSEKDYGVYIAKFDRQSLVGINKGDAVKLTVTGELIDGTKFDGSDIIRVIKKGKK